MALTQGLAPIQRLVTTGRAIVGAVGFCTRFPVGYSRGYWDSFRRQPAVMVLAAYVIGLLAVVPLVVGLPAATATFLFLVWLYLLTGITHLDGLADLGDAMAVHGDIEKRKEVMTDSAAGVGALAAVILVLVGLALAANSLANFHWQTALAVVVTAEVGAKAGVVALITLGTPAHEGLGSALSAESGTGTLLGGAAFSVPLLGLWYVLPAVSPIVPAAAFVAALVGAGAVFLWAGRYLGGVSGDVFGAANEIARVLALHAGVVAWTHW